MQLTNQIHGIGDTAIEANSQMKKIKKELDNNGEDDKPQS